MKLVKKIVYNLSTFVPAGNVNTNGAPHLNLLSIFFIIVLIYITFKRAKLNLRVNVF
jgi:hypothetical protein